MTAEATLLRLFPQSSNPNMCWSPKKIQPPETAIVACFSSMVPAKKKKKKKKKTHHVEYKNFITKQNFFCNLKGALVKKKAQICT